MSGQDEINFLNPKEGLFHTEKNILSGPEYGMHSTRGTERHSSFDGTIAPWTSFDTDVYNFITSPSITRAFDRTARVPMIVDYVAAIKKGVIQSYIFEECWECSIDKSMKDRWHSNVLQEGLTRAHHGLRSKDFGTAEEVADALVDIPNNYFFGPHPDLTSFGEHDAVWVPHDYCPDKTRTRTSAWSDCSWG